MREPGTASVSKEPSAREALLAAGLYGGGIYLLLAAGVVAMNDGYLILDQF